MDDITTDVAPQTLPHRVQLLSVVLSAVAGFAIGKVIEKGVATAYNRRKNDVEDPTLVG